MVNCVASFVSTSAQAARLEAEEAERAAAAKQAEEDKARRAAKKAELNAKWGGGGAK